MRMKRILISVIGVLIALAAAIAAYMWFSYYSMNERYKDLSESKKTWLYQLQNFEADKAAGSGYSLAVIDSTKDGTDETSYTRQELQTLKDNGLSPVAYLSIGEAEHYRSYWQAEWGQVQDGAIRITEQAPDWLGGIANPDWPESVKVRYWEEEWWSAAIKPRLDAIIAAGFDGVYMDIIDAYYYWGQAKTYGAGKETRLESDPEDEREAARRMIAFVRRISEYAKAANPGFAIIPQNGEAILQYDEDHGYLNAIDGIGIEDLWFNETKRQDKSETEYRLDFIRQIAAAGKKVLSVDYVDRSGGRGLADKLRILKYANACGAEGFYCYAAQRSRGLDNLNVISGIQP